MGLFITNCPADSLKVPLKFIWVRDYTQKMHEDLFFCAHLVFLVYIYHTPHHNDCQFSFFYQ